MAAAEIGKVTLGKTKLQRVPALLRDDVARRHARHLRLWRRRRARQGDRAGDLRRLRSTSSTPPASTASAAAKSGSARSSASAAGCRPASSSRPSSTANCEDRRFDAAQARRSVEESLKALGLDRIHLLHLHDPEHARSLSEITGPNGAIRELLRIKEEGLADAVGLAAGRVDVMMPMLRDFDFDAIITHNRFTLTNRNAEPMIDFARSKGMAILNAAPYAGGVLAKGSGSFKRYVYQEASDAVLDPVRRIEAICARHDVPVGAAALQFSMRDARINSTICGVSRPERVARDDRMGRMAGPRGGLGRASGAALRDGRSRGDAGLQAGVAIGRNSRGRIAPHASRSDRCVTPPANAPYFATWPPPRL